MKRQRNKRPKDKNNKRNSTTRNSCTCNRAQQHKFSEQQQQCVGGGGVGSKPALKEILQTVRGPDRRESFPSSAEMQRTCEESACWPFVQRSQHADTHTHRQTHRHTQTQTHRHTHIHTDIQTYTHESNCTPHHAAWPLRHALNVNAVVVVFVSLRLHAPAGWRETNIDFVVSNRNLCVPNR